MWELGLGFRVGLGKGDRFCERLRVALGRAGYQVWDGYGARAGLGAGCGTKLGTGSRAGLYTWSGVPWEWQKGPGLQGEAPSLQSTDNSSPRRWPRSRSMTGTWTCCRR